MFFKTIKKKRKKEEKRGEKEKIIPQIKLWEQKLC